jgi:hypothetical protein
MSSRKSGSVAASESVTKLPRNSIALEEIMEVIRKIEGSNRVQSTLTIHSQGIPLVSKTYIFKCYYRINVI